MAFNKYAIQHWQDACCLLDRQNYREASRKLLEIEKPSAKILFNLGCICMLEGSYSEAIEYFTKSINQDRYLAISYFQRGVCHHHLGRYDCAKDDLTSVMLSYSTEGETCDSINYQQLGAAIALSRHTVEDCLAVTEQCYTLKRALHLPSVPVVDCVFRPAKKLVANLGKQDYLGSAQVISSVENEVVMEHREIANAKLKSPQTARCDLVGQGKDLDLPATPNRPPPRLPAKASLCPTGNDGSTPDHTCGPVLPAGPGRLGLTVTAHKPILSHVTALPKSRDQSPSCVQAPNSRSQSPSYLHVQAPNSRSQSPSCVQAPNSRSQSPSNLHIQAQGFRSQSPSCPKVPTQKTETPTLNTSDLSSLTSDRGQPNVQGVTSPLKTNIPPPSRPPPRLKK
ncbi:NADPH oxidase activator-like [Physella acuta]|uniref:NADPH oxidase activator-like n=1 Tax=Physella acuta TaxID=109671 RepID=UPI0027DD074A|nr:NADPH oxidase activator-like [Physella acuta]XP_059162655.1 NADPH oxidase activator-like [Physella acuta]XP_059162656.1 NADPH oxidase activator-like [Physella acuta]